MANSRDFETGFTVGMLMGNKKATNLTNININKNGLYEVPKDSEYDGYNNINVYVPDRYDEGYADGKESVVIESLSINENGTYTVPEGVKGYNPIMVNVQASGTNIQSLNITENGTYYASNYNCNGFDPITVAVPDNYDNGYDDGYNTGHADGFAIAAGIYGPGTSGPEGQYYAYIYFADQSNSWYKGQWNLWIYIYDMQTKTKITEARGVGFATGVRHPASIVDVMFIPKSEWVYDIKVTCKDDLTYIVDTDPIRYIVATTNLTTITLTPSNCIVSTEHPGPEYS